MKTKIADSKRLNIIGNGDLSSNREILTAMLKTWRQKLGYFSMFAAFPAILTSFAQEAQAGEENKPESSVAGQNVRLLERLNKSCSKPELLRRQSNYLLPYQKSKYNIVSELAGGDNCPGNPIPAGTYTAAAPYTDTGNTTGANNTVRFLDTYYSAYAANGPDQIYSFTLTGRGSHPQIQVSANSAAYQPMIYILDGSFAGGCPAGTNNSVSNWLRFSYAPSPGGTAILDPPQLRSLPLNVPLYLFVDSRFSGANESGPYTVRIQDVGIAPAPPPPPTQSRTKFDFDADSKADISVFRPSDRVWYLLRSQAGFTGIAFGDGNDKPVPAAFVP